MTVSDDEKWAAQIDEAFNLVGKPTALEVARREFLSVKENWKTGEPESFKKDMEEMCKKIFGDEWEAEYQAMLKEEFPEEV
jgi:hypothetical protein